GSGPVPDGAGPLPSQGGALPKRAGSAGRRSRGACRFGASAARSFPRSTIHRAKYRLHRFTGRVGTEGNTGGGPSRSTGGAAGPSQPGGVAQHWNRAGSSGGPLDSLDGLGLSDDHYAAHGSVKVTLDKSHENCLKSI